MKTPGSRRSSTDLSLAETKASEARYRGLLEAAPDAMVVVDQAGDIVLLNVQAEKQFGYRRDELLGQAVKNIIPDGFAERLIADALRTAADALAQQIGTGIELIGRRKDGTEFPIEIMLSPLESADGILVTAAIRDISVRKATELELLHKVEALHALDAALYAEKERVQVTLDSIGDAVASTDLAGSVTFLNGAAQRLTGWTLEEALGKPIGLILDSHDRATRAMLNNGPGKLRSAVAALDLAPGASIIRRDATEIAIEGSMAGIHDCDGRSTGMVVVFRDVTQRRLAERERLRSDERFRRLFESNAIAITITNLSGRIFEANDAYLRLVGYTREEALGLELGSTSLTPPEYSDGNLRAIAQLRATGVAQPWEKEYIRKDGSRVPVLVGVAMLEASDADDATCISYVVDLSGRRLLEEQLRQAQKMEAIGQLAGGVAHDFNNLLMVILGHAEMLLEQLVESDPLRGSVEEIREAGDRAAAMTRQLLAFSRRQLLEPKVLDLNLLIANVEKLLRRMIGEDVQLRIGPKVDGGFVLADAGQMEQVLMNLAVNARDAMPDGGTLSIVLGESVVEDGPASLLSTLSPGQYLTITVRDSGTGMSSDTMDHLFEPFFTTKDVEKGTGLGLATAYGIIKQSGGDIQVASEPGNGATFTIFLPRHDGEADAASQPAEQAERPRAMETLLLVEDEPAVRRLTRRILERRGYHVIEATGGYEALEAARNHVGPIHLLLTDVVMPRMSGPALAEHLRQLRPEMRVVYMSGYADDHVLPSAEGLHSAFLQKPFTSEALTDKLREVVGQPGSQRAAPAGSQP